MAETEHIDPTGLGLLLVAAVSLPLALGNLILDSQYKPGQIASLIGILIMIVAFLCYKANSNFGMVVFALVGTAVFASGKGTELCGAELGIAFGIIFLFFVYWATLINGQKLLILLLITTSLIFLLAGIQTMITGDAVKTVGYALGVAALFNFIFTFWLGAGLCSEGKIKYF